MGSRLDCGQTYNVFVLRPRLKPIIGRQADSTFAIGSSKKSNNGTDVGRDESQKFY